ncbi:putative Ig domain-containing protein, partial [Pedobacter sp. B4-66]|uniref:Ig-like domain-containing protein n=2 Tax=Pedobacter sp. B4-66 TaxID=2817280 RepID=UPI001BDA720A
MKWTSTLPGNLKKSILVLISIITITLLNTKSYAQAKERVYATTQVSKTSPITCLICGISGQGNAVDGDVNTASTISVTTSLLGGNAYQELVFPGAKLSGSTGSVVKVSVSSVLDVDLLGEIVVQAYNGATPVGSKIDINSGLLKLLASGNQSEVFVPGPGGAYDRLRVTIGGGLLKVSAASINVYHAYYLKDATSNVCDVPVEELHGISGSVVALGAVVNPGNAIDGNETTASVLTATAGLAGYTQQTIVFLGGSVVGDSVRMVVSTPAALLEAQLLSSIEIQTFNGNVPGATVGGSGGLLNLRLLSAGGNKAVITFAPTTQFDRVQLRIGGVLSVLSSINLHEVSRVMPTTTEINGTISKLATVCLGEPVVLKINNPQLGATYTWYTQASGGTGTNGTSFTPSSLVAGVNKFYVEAKRTGCSNTSPLAEVIINVNDPVLPSVVAPLPICNGTTATLQVTSPVSGQTYRWYENSTGGAVLFTGTTYNTSILTANKTYFVESVLGNCASARVAVNVVVNSAPSLATITTNNEVISSGQSTILRATADAGNTIKWYAASSGGVALATGANYTTPVLTATTIYYVETVNGSGCLSSSRVPVTVTVIPVTTGLACNAATTQQSGIDGICLLCGISDPGASTDANLTNSTGINLAVGVGATGYQRLIFANKGVATDSIRLDLGIPGGLADVGLLSSATVTVFDGTDVVSTYPLNSSLLNLVLLSGNRVNVTVPAGGVYDRVEIRFGGVLTALTTYNVYGATIIYPNPTVAATGQAICSGSTTTLTATANGGTTLKWYATATSGTALATGNTFTTPALTASTTYYIEVAKGTCANAQRVPVLVTVNPAVTFATTTLANATVNSVYSKQITAATGGTPAFTYALASGSTLPAGLSLSATGVISGTPTAIGDFTFSIIATDSKGCNATAAYALKVTAALALADAILPNGTVGTAYPPQTIPAATGGTGPYVYTAINLPPGLTFTPGTRVISGTPTQAGTFTVPVKVTDANGNTVTKDYTIIVRDPLVLPTAVLADGTVGTLYPTQIIPSATGGQDPYTYAATGLPAGLTFDPATNKIDGTPTTSGTFTIPVTVTDADGKTKTTNYTIKVVDPLALAPKVLADGNVGVVYATQTIPAATGGTGPYTYTATNLPAGLTFDIATREIKGTPTASGMKNVSVTAKDATGKTVTQTYSIKVNGILVLPGATLPNGLVGTAYPEQTLPAVSGGTSPYTYAVTGVPAGLTFDPITRKISGTPTTGGSFTIKLTATDNAGISTSTDYALLVNVGQPVAAGVTTCHGTAGTLTVSNTLPGVTYNWYAATGNTSIASGSSFTTPALTATTTYYVEAVSGTAVSSRTAVTVTINPAPALASILTANENISSGQTATLRASTTEAGSTIKWYAAATGGAAVSTGTNFTTPVLTVTTTYYVGTESAQGCASTLRVPVTVTVTSGPVNPNCNAATTQQSGIDGLCLLCGISDAGASTDANANNFTGINLAVGVGASGYQRLIFANQGSAADSIRLDLGIPTGLADVGVLSSTTVTVFNGTNVVSTYPLNSSLLNLVLLTGSRVNVTVPAGGVYDRVEIRFGGVVTALTTYNVYGATVIYPNPTVAATGQAICSGSTTTLTATANGGTTLRWYASATSGTALATGNTFTTPALTANTTYYIEVAKGSCANVQRVPVLVTVNPAITFATTTLANATVNSAYSKQITAATGGTPAFTYTVASGSTLPAGLSLSATGAISGTPTALGDFTFSIIATDSKGCNATAAYALKVTAALALADAILPNGTVGTAYPPQTLPAATGGTGPYVYVATNLPPGLTFTPGTRVISGTPTQAGTFTVPVKVTDANGNTVTNDYTIIVRDPLLLPTAVLADGTVGTLYPTQIIPSATGGQGPYTYAATGVPAGLTFDPTTRQIKGTPTASGTFTIPVTVTDADGKKVTTNYTIKVVDPLALAPKVLADGNVGVVYATQTIPAATGGTGPYTYTATNLPAGLTFDIATREIKGTPTASGTSSVSVTAKDAAGRTVTQTYSIKVNGILVLPGATLPNGLVGTAYPEQTLPAVSGGTSPYTYAATGVPAGLTFDPITRKISGTPTLGGSFTIKLTATDNAGISTSTDYALLVNVGQPVVAGVTTCNGTTGTLTVSNTLPGVTYNWYAATGNTSIASGSSFTTPALTATTTYYVEAVSGTAVSSRTAVTVTINPAPALASILTANENISSGQTATLRASTTEAGSTIKWYAAATGGAALATGANFTTPVLTATTTYYVGTESAQGCASTSRVPVTVTVTSGPVNPNCNAATTQQSGIDGLCLLCGISDAGASTDANANNFTGIHLAVGVGAQGYQKLIFGKTGSATDSIRLDLGIPTGLADVGVLAGTTVTVFNGTTVVSTYPLNSSLLNLVLLSGSRVNVTVPAGGVYDRVEIRFGALITALTTYNVYGATIIYPNPTVAATGQTICSGSTTTLTATANGGTTLKWYASATSGTVLATGNTFTTPALTATTTYYIEVSKDGCANVERIPVTVTVTTTPSNPTVATVAPICSGSAAILAITAPVNGITYKWYAAVNGGASLFTGSSFTTPVLTASTTYYVEASAGNCTSVTRTAVAVTVNTLPALATVTTNNSTISAGQTATLAATAPAGITIKWYSAPTGGVALAQGTSYTTAPLSATTTYYVETSNASGCVSATRVPVTVTVLGGPVNPNCNAANSQQSGIEGICVLCTIQNAGNSIDNNFTNFTTISLPVGVGGSGYQRLIFGSPGVATDSIRLDLETPGGLADVTLLGGIKVTVMNGSSVVKTYNLQSSLLNLTLLSGKRFTATLPAGGVYDRVEVRAEGLANVLVNLNIYGATIVYPNPTVSAAGQTICSGSATVLSAAANGGTTLRWYSAATNGTLLHTGENFTTPVLTATTTYYIEVSKGSCANVTRVPVTVKVTTAPGLPTVAAVAPVCSGSTAVISVTAPVAGTDYNWYTTATGGTAIFTGSTFTTPVLTSGITYYVEAANGTCVSATRVAVPVTVNPLPVLPQISASATAVNVGQTVVLTGTSTDANVTFNWYTSANSTTPVYTGPTYVTSPLTVTTTYFLEAKNASGCTSSARAQVTITVNGGGPNPIACEAPTTQENGVDGVALLAGVFNPLLAIDNDSKTGSSLVMPVGLLGASVYQRVGFNTLSNVGDTVRVSISAPGKLLSVGLLSNIMIGTYNGNSSNSDGVPLNDQLVRIELLSGNTEALVTFVPTKRFNKIEVRLNSGLAGVLSTVDFKYAQRVVVAPVVTAQNVTICANQTATLAVQTPLPGITYKWYNEAGAYQTGKDGATFTTPALSANTKFYVEAVTASGCTSYRTSVNVIVTPAPTTPILVNATINSCVGNQVTIEVSNPLVGVTYKWYDGTGTYIPLKDGVTFTTTVGAAQTTYSVEATTSCGTSGKATATIKIGTLNPPVITPANVTISSGSPAVLVATSSTAGAVFKWYSDATLATLVHTGAQYTTGALDNTTNAPIIKTFYVTVETTGVGACPASAAASVDVTILPKPIPGAIPCQAATVAIKDGVDGLAVLSAVFNPGFAVDNNSESGSSFVMPVGALGASVYQQVGFTGGLSSVGDTLRLRITSPGKLLSLGVLSSIEVTTLNNGASNNDMLVISNPIVDVQILSGNSEAIITYVPQKQFDGVELRLRSGLAAVLTTLDFNYAQRILVAPSVQSATATACTGTSANLFVKNPVTGLTYKWFMRNGQTITYLTGKDGVSLATDPTLAAGTYDFYVAAVNDAIDCLSAKTKITVTILAAPDAPVAATGNPATTCPNTSATLAVNPVAGVTFNWYSAATGGNLLTSNTNTYITPANLAVGAHDFYVEAVNGNSCVNTTPRTKITLTINPSAVAADINVAGANAPFCAGTSAKLTATSTTVTNPVFTWYSDAALTDVVFTGPIFNTPLLTATTTYYVSVTGSNKCANTPADAKVVTLTVNPPATAADLDVTGGSAPFCAGAKVELTATTTTVTNPIFNWYSDAALTKLVFTGDKFVIASLAATTTYYVTVSGSNKCENLASNAEIVTLIVNPPAIASDISVTGNQAPFCAGAKATLSATSATVLSPVFTWYSDAALTDVVFTGATFITPVLTATKTYYVTVRGSNKCENTAATAKTVTVTVNPPATAADINVAGADAPYCAGTKAKLVATTTTVTAPIFNWYSDAALTKLVFTGVTFETPVLTATTTYYVTVKGSNRCENTSATAKTVTVTVNPPALATDINVAGADAPFCSGNIARLVATSTTVTNPVFTWYSDAALTTAVFTGPVFNTPALTATTTYYVTVRGSNKCENAAGDAKIITLTVNPPATAADIIVKGADSPFCAGTTATLDASSTTVTNPVFTWYSDAALTNAVFTGAKFVTPVLTATTKYYVTVRGSNKCENLAANAKVVTLTVNPPATAADLSVTGNSAPLCAGATATLTATSTTVTSPKFTWYSDAALTTVAFSGPIFKTPVLTATTTYYVTVSGSNKCETLAADAKVVTVTVNPPATAADINVAGNDAPFCAGTKATLVASSTTITNPVFTWYSDAALTTVVFTGSSFETPVLTATKTYYVTVRGDNKCENTAATAKTVTVVVNPPATAADINVDGAADPLCSGTSAKLTATSTTVTNPVFTWYSDAALTTVVFTGPVFDTPVLTATTTYYVTVRGSNKCENATGDAKIITLKVNPPATAADIIVKGADSPLCAGTTATLDASSTTVTNPVFTWYSDAALTNAVFTGAKFVTPVLTATTTYYVTVRGDNKCENLAANAKVVTVTINPPATVADLSVTGNSAPLCAGATATLTATSTTVTNPKFTWYSDAALTDVVFTGSIFKTPVLTATTTYYVTVRGDNRCETLAADAKVVTVTVNPPATAADINVAGNDAPFCAGTKATLVASSTTITNPVFTWYSDAALTTVVFTGSSFETPVLTATKTYYVTVRGDNKCENTAATAKTVTVVVNPP